MFNLFEFSDLSCYKSENRSSREDPVTAYNAATHKLCKFMINAAGLPADNPQQSDECSHIGLKANCNCRRCKAGGTTAEKESDTGYRELHEVRNCLANLNLK